MIRYHYKKAKLLLVGINPHHGSNARGIPFSNNKTFWYLLARAGLLRDTFDDLRNDAYLRDMYTTRFTAEYGLGFVNLIDRPTRDVSELRAGEGEFGRRRLERIVRREKPRVVCFVGKVTYATYSGLKQFDFGWNGAIGDSRVYVMHFPLHGKASVRIREFRLVAAAAGLRSFA